MTRTVEVVVPEDCTLEQLEEIIGEQLQATGGKLLLDACRALEERYLREGQGRFQLNKRRARDLLTRFGWVRLERWSARDRASGQYRSVLDEQLGIEPRQHASPWVLARAVALATRMSYREATAVLSDLIGTALDHRTVWGWVQESARAGDQRGAAAGQAALPAVAGSNGRPRHLEVVR